MEKLKYLHDLFSKQYQIKKNFGTVVSNIYPGNAILEEAYRKDKIEVEQTDESIFAFEKARGFYKVYFASPKAEGVLSNLDSLAKDFSEPLVLEHVIREGKDECLGEPSQILKRMVHQGILSPALSRQANKAIPFHTKDAEEKDIYDLEEIFENHFNPLTERIPDRAELLNLIHGKSIKLAVGEGKIVGFIIFQKEGVSLHLRYWWTAAGYRGMGVGSMLMHHFIVASGKTGRQFLWVFSDNENAIKRYRHYGFEFDGTEDDIYIFNK